MRLSSFLGYLYFVGRLYFEVRIVFEFVLIFLGCFHSLSYQKFMSVALFSQAKKSECGSAQPSSSIAGDKVLNDHYRGCFHF